jgi:hypothetical protein
MQVGGQQRVKGAQGRLVASVSARVPGDEDVTTRVRIVVLTLAL